MIPNFNEIRQRAQQRIAEVRGTISTRKNTGTQRFGNGVIVNNIMNKANTISQRIMERKPGMIPMVKEFKPGDRLRQVMSPQPAIRRTVTGGSTPITQPLLQRKRNENIFVQM